MQQILRDRPFEPRMSSRSMSRFPGFLTGMVPFHEPLTGLQAKYSLEYDLATVVLDGRAGIHQYTDEASGAPWLGR